MIIVTFLLKVSGKVTLLSCVQKEIGVLSKSELLTKGLFLVS